MQVGAERRDVAIDAARRLHRVDVQQAAGARARSRRSRRSAGSRRSRCWRASPRPAALAPEQWRFSEHEDRPRRRHRPAVPRRRPARKRPPRSTEGCSIAETNSRSRGSLRPPISSAGVSASMLASVAPLVKVTFFASAPTSAATCARARPRPAGAPRAPRHAPRRRCRSAPARATSAARASARSGAVAFQSK